MSLIFKKTFIYEYLNDDSGLSFKIFFFSVISFS